MGGGLLFLIILCLLYIRPTIIDISEENDKPVEEKRKPGRPRKGQTTFAPDTISES